MFPPIAMSRFCGFPIGLMTLPIVTANAKERSRSFGEILCFLAKYNMRRVPIMASVSFISKADSRPMLKRTVKTR